MAVFGAGDGSWRLSIGASDSLGEKWDVTTAYARRARVVLSDFVNNIVATKRNSLNRMSLYGRLRRDNTNTRARPWADAGLSRTALLFTCKQMYSSYWEYGNHWWFICWLADGKQNPVLRILQSCCSFWRVGRNAAFTVPRNKCNPSFSVYTISRYLIQDSIFNNAWRNLAAR